MAVPILPGSVSDMYNTVSLCYNTGETCYVECIMKLMKKYRIWFVLLAVFAVSADQIIKHCTGTDTERTLISGVLSLTYAKNTGISFSMFTDSNLALIIITSLIACGVIAYALIGKPDLLRQCALGMIAGGAAGNIFDRISLGYVHDMIRFDFISFPVFNIADSFIVIGAVILAFSVIFEKDAGKMKKSAAEKKKGK